MIDLTIPGLRLVSELNTHASWRGRAKRVKAQREAAYWHSLGVWGHRGVNMDAPIRVTITRIAPRRLDSDNAVGSAKAVRDGIADALGVNDGDPRIEWVVLQQSGDYGVRIQIEALQDTAVSGGARSSRTSGT